MLNIYILKLCYWYFSKERRYESQRIYHGGFTCPNYTFVTSTTLRSPVSHPTVHLFIESDYVPDIYNNEKR